MTVAAANLAVKTKSKVTINSLWSGREFTIDGTAASLDALKEQSDPLIFTVPNDFITFTYVLTVFYLSALLTIAVYLLKKRNREEFVFSFFSKAGGDPSSN